MKRRALLIDAGRAALDEIIDGCKVDVERMRDWLGTNVGGAWDAAEEIISLHNQPLATIERAVKWAGEADFAFVAFSGHGEIHEVRGVRSQIVYVGQGTAEKIDFARLYPKSAKSIVICDACRRIHVKSPIRMSLAESVQRYVKASSARYSRADYKREYLRLVGEAGGRYLVYSCSPGQLSGDDENHGGRFTSTLLRSAEDWLTNEAKPRTHLTIGGAFGKAMPLVSTKSRAENKNYPQDAEAFSSIRSLSASYPFVIRYD